MARPSRFLHNTWHLGIKEFHSLLGDPTMLFLISRNNVFMTLSPGHIRPIAVMIISIALIPTNGMTRPPIP